MECDPSAEKDATITIGAEIKITRFSDLQQRPEIQGNILAFGNQITPSDILMMDLEVHERVLEIAYPDSKDFIRFEVVSQTPVNITYVNNGVKQTMPAVFAETALIIGSPNSTIDLGVSTKQYGLYTVTPDQQTGYSLLSARWPSETQSVPAPIDQMLRSFEVIAATSAQ
jgi:hypothetical protein